MERTTTFWFLLIIFLGISINGGFSQGQGQQHALKKTRSSAVVVGSVYCDTCFNGAFSKSPNHLIPGALVEVECLDENSKPSFRQEVKTDEHGEFKAKLPFSVSKHVKKIKRCSVKLISSSQPYCSIAASATSSSLKRLRTRNHGENTRVFSAGFFTFKPQNQPEICSQKPITLHDTKPLLPDPTFPPPIQDPVPSPSPLPIPNLPAPSLPIPNLPAPSLPIPNLPAPSLPIPNLPAPSLPVPNLPAPSLPVPNLPAPSLPMPNLPAPSLPVPNLPAPSLPVPNIPIVPPVSDLPLPQIPPVLPPGPPRKPATLHNKKTDSLEDKKTEVLKPNFFFLPPNPLNPPLIPPVPLIPSPPTLPPIPFVPSPPTLPLPPLPLVPAPATPTLPLPLPPIPGLTPPPPSSSLPPLPTIPALPPIPTLPPLPGITPPPSPPPPTPSFPVPIPPIFPGVPPIFPGIPPASSSFSSHHQP